MATQRVAIGMHTYESTSWLASLSLSKCILKATKERCALLTQIQVYSLMAERGYLGVKIKIMQALAFLNVTSIMIWGDIAHGFKSGHPWRMENHFNAHSKQTDSIHEVMSMGWSSCRWWTHAVVAGNFDITRMWHLKHS